MKVKDISDFFNMLYPFENKCEWDNCGLLVGDGEMPVSRIGFALDLTDESLKDAVDKGVQLVVTHHPVIFSPQKSFLAGNTAYEAAKNGISVISCHTCYDCAKGGVSEILAQHLGLIDIEVVETSEKPDCVRMGSINTLNASDFVLNVSNLLGTNVRVFIGAKNINKVAVCGGAGGEFINEAFAAGADAYVTGEIKHHEFLIASKLGLTAVAAGHFETENIAIPNLLEKVKHEFPEIECILLKQNNPVINISAEG